MIKIYKKSFVKNGSKKLLELKRPTPGCWINISAPSEDEIEEIKAKFGLPKSLIHDILDYDSLPRIEKEVEKGLSLILLKVPFHSEQSITTVPLGIVFSPKKNYIFTICSAEVYAVEKLISNPLKGFVTDNKAVFFNYLMRKIIKSYMNELNVVENEISVAETSINKSFQNKEVILLLSLQKTLVYFRTSIVGNKKVLGKFSTFKIFSMNEEEKEDFDDVLIDVDEAQQLVTIYSEIIANTINAYNSIVSNNFNSILKFLALVTVSISIPTMVASYYGMNIDLPFQGSPEAFLIVVGFALLSTSAVLIFFKFKNWV